MGLSTLFGNPVIQNDLPERLKRLREGARLTQAQLAKTVGVSEGTVNKWETGKQGLRGKNQTAVARALGVTVEELVGPTENVSRETSPDADLQELFTELAKSTPAERRQMLYLLRALRASGSGELGGLPGS